MADASKLWLATEEQQPKNPPAQPAPNVSHADMRRIAREKAERETGQPVNQSVDNQLTSVVNQLTTPQAPAPAEPLVNQLTSQPAAYLLEQQFRSRRERKLKGVRLPINKIEKYELWCLLNKADFQEAVEFAMDWLTSQPVNQLTGQPANQLTTLINNNINNLIINDEKAKKISERYTELTGRKFNASDLEAYREVAAVDLTLTMNLMSVVMDRARRAGSQVNGFRYFVRDILRGSQMSQPSQPEERRDYSACPDCKGTGFYYPEGIEKGVSKCQHSNL